MCPSLFLTVAVPNPQRFHVSPYLCVVLREAHNAVGIYYAIGSFNSCNVSVTFTNLSQSQLHVIIQEGRARITAALNKCNIGNNLQTQRTQRAQVCQSTIQSFTSGITKCFC